MKAPSGPGSVWTLLFSAWLVALLSTLGALYIGEIMGQSPCVLCWFQRAFMFPLAIILAVASYTSDAGAWRYALPVAGVGWLIAFYHALLYFGVIAQNITPCGIGPSCSSSNMLIFDGIPIPFLSLLSFTAIIALLIPISWRSHE
ncbi:disulfide bond formation protein B [Novosphingobium pentaromativorans]